MNIFLGLEHPHIEKYELDVCKLNLRNLSDMQVAIEIAAMTKQKYILLNERSGNMNYI